MIKDAFAKILIFFNQWKWVFILSFFCSILFFVLRLLNLTLFPIFADEAIYIRWAQVMRAEPTLRFLPLSVGSPPFFMWSMMPFLKLSQDPLFAGRFLSVICGFGSLIGLFWLSFLIFGNKKISFFSILFYTVIPYYVFSERMALIDSMLSLEAVWLVILAILFIKKTQLDLAIIAGVVFGVSLMTKSFAVLFIIPLFSALLLREWNLKKKEEFFANFIKTILGLFLILGIGFGIYNFILRLGPNFSLISSRNDFGTYSLKEIIVHPLDPLLPHFYDLLDWFPNLISPVIFVFSLLGLFFGIKRKKKEAIFLVLCSFGPILVESFLAKVFTPRYLLYAIWPFVILSSYFMDILLTYFKEKQPKLIFSFIGPIFLILLLIFPALRYDWLLINQPEKSPLPRNLRSGHLEEWSAGQGIKEVADFLKKRAQGKKILVGTEGSFGTLPDGLQIYLQNTPNITVIGIGLYPDKIPQALLNSLVDHDEVYLVINDERLAFKPETQNAIVIAKYPKAKRPNGTFQSLLLMRINPEK